jgi:hypothetical protein
MIMQAWANHVIGKAAASNVTPLRRRHGSGDDQGSS